MTKVRFEYDKAAKFISNEEMQFMKSLANNAKEALLTKSGAGSEFTGWVDLPVDYDKEEFDR
ncbi:MAG: glucose-6-phosphate isomerase, partial [Lachnospiraceae bacterium]|nr:glucose-6-phosphate isomerase [Lachnospiraceae bacterium]